MIRTFVPQISPRTLPQLLVDQGSKRIQRCLVTLAPLHQELGHISRHCADFSPNERFMIWKVDFLRLMRQQEENATEGMKMMLNLTTNKQTVKPEAARN